MNKFIEYEKVERILFEKLMMIMLITGYTLSTIGNYSRSDGEYINNDNEKIRFEIKVRNHSINKYPDFLLEYDKLEHLHRNKGYNKIYYINFFKECDDTYSCIMFDLSSRIKKWLKEGKKKKDIFYNKSLPISTAQNRGWKSKYITMIDYENFDTIIRNIKMIDNE